MDILRQMLKEEEALKQEVSQLIEQRQDNAIKLISMLQEILPTETMKIPDSFHNPNVQEYLIECRELEKTFLRIWINTEYKDIMFFMYKKNTLGGENETEASIDEITRYLKPLILKKQIALQSKIRRLMEKIEEEKNKKNAKRQNYCFYRLYLYF